MPHDNKKNIKSSLSFINYIVDYIVFKNNENFSDNEVVLDFDIVPEFEINKEESEMIVGINLEVFRESESKNYPFELNIKVIGFFKLTINDDFIERYKTNAIAIMYPYIRSLVTTYTANANVAPLVLPTINVNKLLENKNKS